ncbi:hypothetical protein ACHAQH_008836 [Verticillium albo-atrum]
MPRVQRSYTKTIKGREDSGYAKWGFVIYRGTHNNDTQWENFMTLLKELFAYELRHVGQYEELWHDLLWTVIEDRDSLDGAPKDVIRARFREWVAARSVERDGPGGDAPCLTKDIPRFRYCIYVDQASMLSLTAEPTQSARQWLLDGEVVIIDGTHGHHDEDIHRLRSPNKKGVEEDEDREDDASESEESEDIPDEEYSLIEGNSAEDVGWTYISVIRLIGQYEEWHNLGTDWEMWDWVYRGRRPETGPRTGRGVPISTVDLSGREL